MYTHPYEKVKGGIARGNEIPNTTSAGRNVLVIGVRALTMGTPILDIEAPQ